MWNFSEKTDAQTGGPGDSVQRTSPRPRVPVSPRLLLIVALLTAHCSLLTGCRRDMQDQPKAIAYRENSFFKDGTGSRPLVEGTVPRGYLRQDRAFYFGKKATAQATPQSPQTPSAQAAVNSQAGVYPA